MENQEKQLPEATITNKEYNGFLIKSANSIQAVEGAISIAMATGSVGANHYENYPVTESDFNPPIKYFAIVEKIN